MKKIQDIKVELVDSASGSFAVEKVAAQEEVNKSQSKQVKEINGPKGLEPTRYGDWESKGRCHDF